MDCDLSWFGLKGRPPASPGKAVREGLVAARGTVLGHCVVQEFLEWRQDQIGCFDLGKVADVF